MKYVPHAAALVLSATQAAAGGLSDQIMEAPVAVEEAAPAPAGSADWILPILILGLLAGVALSGGSDDDGMAAPSPVCPGPVPPVCNGPIGCA